MGFDSIFCRWVRAVRQIQQQVVSLLHMNNGGGWIRYMAWCRGGEMRWRGNIRRYFTEMVDHLSVLLLPRLLPFPWAVLLAPIRISPLLWPPLTEYRMTRQRRSRWIWTYDHNAKRKGNIKRNEGQQKGKQQEIVWKKDTTQSTTPRFQRSTSHTHTITPTLSLSFNAYLGNFS